MKKFIIKCTALVNGESERLFFKTLEVSDRADTMNAFTTHLTSKENEAMIFHEQDEAIRMSAFISNSMLVTTIKTISHG